MPLASDFPWFSGALPLGQSAAGSWPLLMSWHSCWEFAPRTPKALPGAPRSCRHRSSQGPESHPGARCTDLQTMSKRGCLIKPYESCPSLPKYTCPWISLLGLSDLICIHQNYFIVIIYFSTHEYSTNLEVQLKIWRGQGQQSGLLEWKEELVLFSSLLHCLRWHKSQRQMWECLLRRTH